MSNQGIIVKVTLPYAEALLESAQKSSIIDKTNQDLSMVCKVISESLELRLFLENPLITLKEKKNILKNLFLEQVTDLVLKFLFILVDKRRIALLNSITQKYLELAYQLNSVTIAKVRTAIAFTELQQSSLISKLQEITNSKEVKLVIMVDPSLLGGFIVQIGCKIIDMSLAGRLEQMSFYLKGSIC